MFINSLQLLFCLHRPIVSFGSVKKIQLDRNMRDEGSLPLYSVDVTGEENEY